MFGRRNVTERAHEPAVVEPVDPFENGELEVLDAAQVRQSASKPGIDAGEVLAYLSDLEELLAEGFVEEQRTVLKGFVTEIVKGDDAATVYYTLPMLPGQEKIGAVGGAEGTRTPDPLLAKQVLSQLSYSPT